MALTACGTVTIDGVPYLNGKPASENLKHAGSIFERLGQSKWRCPECESALSEASPGEFICLNACHLTAAAYQRFQSLLNKAAQNCPNI